MNKYCNSIKFGNLQETDLREKKKKVVKIYLSFILFKVSSSKNCGSYISHNASLHYLSVERLYILSAIIIFFECDALSL